MKVFVLVKNLFPESFWPGIWLVGDTARDTLLCREVQDIGLAGVLTSDQLSSCGFKPINPATDPQVWIRCTAKIGKIEVTRLSSAHALPGYQLSRDFTVNALALSLDGHVVDNCNGLNDVEQRSLRPCSDGLLEADPLSIFRAFRLEADGWRITPDTIRMIGERPWGRSKADIPIQRFSCEMIEALGKPEPQRFFRCMIKMNIGSELLPELFRMQHIPAGPPDKHPEGDLLSHSLQVMQHMVSKSLDPLARFCAMFHDLGKLETDPALYPKHYDHHHAGQQVAGKFCDRLGLPTSWKIALMGVCRLHTTTNNWHLLRDATKLRLAEQATKLGINVILPLVSAADKSDDKVIEGWNEAVRTIKMDPSDLGVDLSKLAAMTPENSADYILQKRVAHMRRK